MIRRHKLTITEMGTLGLIGAICLIISNFSLQHKKIDDYNIMLEASKKTLTAYEIVKKFRTDKGIQIDQVNDPSESGLIGFRDSPITTSLGVLESKQTSINPNWSAVVIKYLRSSGVKSGDAVVLSMTGSFPALDIAAIIGIETYGAVPICLISEGASTWGANIPGFSIVEIYNELLSKNIIKSLPVAAFLGGNNNAGGGLTPEGRKIIRNSIIDGNLTLIDVAPLSASIKKGLEMINERLGNRHCALYFNIGAGLASLGTSQVGTIIKPGLNQPNTYLKIQEEPVQGYIAHFLRKGIPVMNLLDIIKLAKDNFQPIAPAALVDPGLGEFFIKAHYNLVTNGILLLSFLLSIIAISLGFTDFIFKKNKEKGMIL